MFSWKEFGKDWAGHAVSPFVHFVTETKELKIFFLCQVQFSSLQSLDRLGHWGELTDKSAEVLFQSFLKDQKRNSLLKSVIKDLVEDEPHLAM